jgi:hypothetical protein
VIAKLAAARGAGGALIARVAGTPSTRTVALGLIPAGAAAARRGAVLDLQAGSGAIVDAAERMLDAAASPGLDLLGPPGPGRPRAWYDRPWVWGAAGAALAAVILLPLALDDQPNASFQVRPGGDTPP